MATTNEEDPSEERPKEEEGVTVTVVWSCLTCGLGLKTTGIRKEEQKHKERRLDSLTQTDTVVCNKGN